MTDTPSTPITPAQADAQVALEAILSDKQHPYYHAEHPDAQRAVEDVLALRRAAAGEHNQPLVTFREPGDGPVQGVASAPIQPEEPALAGGRRFDDGMVAQLDAALVDAGLSRHTGTMLRGVLAQEHNAGTLGKWTEEDSGAYLAKKYGIAAADELITDAQRAAALLPASLKQWLRETNAATNPKLILECAMLYRRSRHGRR